MVRRPLIAVVALTFAGLTAQAVAQTAPAPERPLNRRAAGPSLGDVLKAAVEAGAASTLHGPGAPAGQPAPPRAVAQPAPVAPPPPLGVPPRAATATPIRPAPATPAPVASVPAAATPVPFGHATPPPRRAAAKPERPHPRKAETAARAIEPSPKPAAIERAAKPARAEASHAASKNEGAKPAPAAAKPAGPATIAAAPAGPTRHAPAAHTGAARPVRPQRVATEPVVAEPLPAPPPQTALAPKTTTPNPHVASLTPAAPSAEEHAGRPALTLGFAGATDTLTPKSDESLRRFADAFAMREGRVEIVAYATSPDKSLAAARRLSLRRALVVREVLIERGIPTTRIDVRALGGTEVAGDPDRLDLLIEQGPSTEPPYGGPSSGG